jgi:hypothetical protein
MNLVFLRRLFVIAGSLSISALQAQTSLNLASAPNLAPAQIVDSVIAHAGGESWARPKTLQLRGAATFYFQGKAENAIDLPVYKMWRVYPDKSRAAHEANGKVRFDAFSRPKGSIKDSTYFQVCFDGKSTYQFYSPEAEPQREASLWENNFGFGILRFARDTAFRLVRMADDQIEGRECYFLRIIDPKQAVTDFAIDKRDYAIRYVGFKTPRGFHHRIYSDFAWHDNPRFLQPKRVRLYYDGVKWTDIYWREFEVNKPIADSVFIPR